VNRFVATICAQLRLSPCPGGARELSGRKQIARLHPLDLSLFAAALALVSLRPAVAADVEAIDGVPHVRNGSTPAQGRVDVELRELWRVGGANEDVLLGAVGSAVMDEAGNVYLLDSQLNQALVIAPDGKLVRTLGGEGEGPGELRGLGSGFFMPNGDLALVQTFPGKVVTVKRDGTPGANFQFLPAGAQVASFGVLVAGDARGGNLVLTGMTMNQVNTVIVQTYYLSFCNPQGSELHRCFSKDTSIDFANFVSSELDLDFAWSRWALGPDGNLYAAPERNGYRIHVIDPTGKLLRVIEREYEPYRRSSEDMQLAQRYVEAVGRNYPVPPKSCKVEELDSDINGLFVSSQGELWVMPGRGMRNLPKGIGVQYDVFDRDGQFVRQAAVRGTFNADRDLVRVLRDDRILVVLGAAEGYLNSMGVGEGEGEGAGGTSAGTAPTETPVIEAILYAVQ
jgi:hypothetical protein